MAHSNDDVEEYVLGMEEILNSNQIIAGSLVSKKLINTKRLILYTHDGTNELLGLVLRVDQAT